MSSTKGQPILIRLDRLDTMMSHLEEINRIRSSKSSSPTSSTPPYSESVEFYSGARRRPIDTVLMETELKGSLVDRLSSMEHRMAQIFAQLEEEEDSQRRKNGKMNPYKRAIKKLIPLSKHDR